MSTQKIDQLLQKFSSKLAEMTQSKNGLSKNPNNSSNLIQPKQKFGSLIDKKDLSQNKLSLIQRTHTSNQSSTGENVDVGSSKQNVMDLSDKQSEQSKKKQKDKIMKAISQVVNARSKNQPNVESTQSINNPQTRLKSSSPNQNTPQESKTVYQNSPVQNTLLMPKVSSMNNLIKLSSKLTPQSILSEIKTRGFKEKISPIRYLLYFCIQKILYTLWRDNGVQIMSIKLNNPMEERKFLCAEILKGVLQLLTYFVNLERPLISKIIMSVFNRLGLNGIFNESWLPNCVKANMSIFQKTKAKVQELLIEPKTKNITSNIFNNIPNYENLKNYDHLGLQLEDEHNSNERIDEIDKGVNQNKLFFFKNKPISRNIQAKADSTQNKNSKKKLNNFRKQQTDEESSKELVQKVPQKEVIHKKILESKFEIALQKINVPENTIIFSQQNNEKGRLINKTGKRLASQASIPEQKIDKQLQSQKRARPESKYLVSNWQQNFLQQEEKSDYIHASRHKIQQMIQEHLFNNIHEITEKIMKKFKVKPAQVNEVLKQTVLNKVNPTKILKDHFSPQQIAISRVEQKPKKSITAISQKPKKLNNIAISEAQKKLIQTPLTNKQLIALVDKKSIELADSGYSQKEIINEIFKLLEGRNVSYDKKQQILEAWFESREFGMK